MKSITLSEEMTKYREILSESWGTKMHTPASKKGMFKGKSKDELRKELTAAKARSKGHKDAGTKEPESLKTKIKELEFALRAKNSFGKVNEDDDAYSRDKKCEHTSAYHKEGKKCVSCGKSPDEEVNEDKKAGDEAVCKDCKKMPKNCVCESKTMKQEKTCKKCKKTDSKCICESKVGPFSKNGSVAKALSEATKKGK